MRSLCVANLKRQVWPQNESQLAGNICFTASFLAFLQKVSFIFAAQSTTFSTGNYSGMAFILCGSGKYVQSCLPHSVPRHVGWCECTVKPMKKCLERDQCGILVTCLRRVKLCLFAQCCGRGNGNAVSLVDSSANVFRATWTQLLCIHNSKLAIGANITCSVGEIKGDTSTKNGLSEKACILAGYT